MILILFLFIFVIVFSLVVFVFYIKPKIVNYHEKMNFTVGLRLNKYDVIRRKVKDLPKVKFEDFLSLFNINPDGYKLYEAFVARRTKEEDFAFSFGIIDFYKYQLFIKEEVKNRDKAKMLFSILNLAKKGH